MNETFVPVYDLEGMSETQRQAYVKAVCRHMGIPDDLNLVMLTYLDEQDGPRRLVAYAKRGATEIIRNSRGINVVGMDSKEIGGSIVFTVTGKDSTGRQEMSTGAKYITGLTGRELDDAIMTSQTRATRRMTLQFVGAGVLDESEVNPKLAVEVKNTTPIVISEQPTVIPSGVPGTDITETVSPNADNVTKSPNADPKSLETHIAEQAKIRQDAIDFLNAEKPVKRTRKRKDVVDMGPSTNPVVTTSAQQGVIVIAVPTQVVPAVPTQVVPVTVVPEPAEPVRVQTTAFPVVKPKLSPEVIKPYRQRQFKFITDMELKGFAPKDGTGNLDKMRSYVGLMFPEVTNFNELSAEQWEKYLTDIENRIKANGEVATIKYIEDAIGI